MRLLNRPLGRLSRHRRGPVAGLLVVLLGLMLTGGLYAAFSPASSARENDSAAQIKKGHQLFLVGCSFCHGNNGQGVKTLDGNQLGPPLAGVGAAAVDFQVGTGRMPMAQPGPQAARKKPVYDAAEIEALGAYVQSLGPGPAVPEADTYQPSTDNEDIVRGGSFFRTNCTACHNFAGSGGALPNGKHAPDLRGVSAKHMYEAMLTGPQQMPVFSDGVLSPQDKRDIISYLKKNEATPSYGGFTLGSLGPVSEGMFAWLLGIGGLVGVGIWITSSTARVKRKTTTEGDA